MLLIRIDDCGSASCTSSCSSYLTHLNKCDLALANITAGVSDGDLSVVFNPTLSTENVMDAGRHLVPLIVVSRSRKQGRIKTGEPVYIAP